MKKLLSLLLVLCLFFGLLPTMASAAENPFKGKVISILGDSISTYEGYIPTADGYNKEHLTSYPQGYLLTDVNETWWMQVINQTEAKLGINDSWRGTSICGSENGAESSYMGNPVRLRNLGSNGTPDVIFFYGGTNDLARTPEVGQFDPASAPQTVDLFTNKWDNLADGYVNTLLRLRFFFPNALIICLLPTYTRYFYTNEKLDKANEVLTAICEHYNMPYVALRDCGISTSDLPDGVHPNANGMDYITEAVLAKMAECEIESGENVVHSITHKLSDAVSSLGYYKGVSHGKPFSTRLTGNNLNIRVTMGGEDITNECYSGGVIRIEAVTDDVLIADSAKSIYADYLQPLPETFCSETNLWPLLKHQEVYYNYNGWDVHQSGTVHSVTVPIQAGDRIWATSFQAAGLNGSSMNGIRMAWFSEKGLLKSVDTTSVYKEFSANGYITAPQGAFAVNVVMWNGDATNEFYILSREHNYHNHICSTCGKHQPRDDIRLTPAVTVGASMTINYTITADDMASFIDFILVVRHDTADGNHAVTTYNSREMTVVKHPVSAKVLMYNASFKEISAKEMGDNFTATLYAIGTNGTLYYGPSVTTSVKSALIEKLNAPSTKPEWKTMAIDMLKYGAAAQLHFGYGTDRLVTADLTKEQLAYATVKIPSAVDSFAVEGEGANVTTNITLGARVELHLSCIGTDVSDPSAVRCVITDDSGEMIAELSAINIANVMFSTTYDDVGAKQMRRPIKATFYEGDKPISKTVTWSVESYVAQVCADSLSKLSEVRMVIAMLIYGDSVAAYMAA